LLFGLGCVPVPAQEPPRVLTTALEIRSLSPAEADRGIPVRLRGVVVFVEGVSALFLQDETSTTLFRLEKAPLPRVGDEIELTAKTRMGLYLPGVDYATYRILGRRALPPEFRSCTTISTSAATTTNASPSKASCAPSSRWVPTAA
jgi:hypothetical protein